MLAGKNTLQKSRSPVRNEKTSMKSPTQASMQALSLPLRVSSPLDLSTTGGYHIDSSQKVITQNFMSSQSDKASLASSYLTQVQKNYKAYHHQNNFQQTKEFSKVVDYQSEEEEQCYEEPKILDATNQFQESLQQQVESFQREIERRYASSSVNQLYKFPIDSAMSSPDSEASIISLQAVSTYDLQKQNLRSTSHNPKLATQQMLCLPLPEHIQKHQFHQQYDQQLNLHSLSHTQSSHLHTSTLSKNTKSNTLNANHQPLQQPFSTSLYSQLFSILQTQKQLAQEQQKLQPIDSQTKVEISKATISNSNNPASNVGVRQISVLVDLNTLDANTIEARKMLVTSGVNQQSKERINHSKQKIETSNRVLNILAPPSGLLQNSAGDLREKHNKIGANNGVDTRKIDKNDRESQKTFFNAHPQERTSYMQQQQQFNNSENNKLGNPYDNQTLSSQHQPYNQQLNNHSKLKLEDAVSKSVESHKSGYSSTNKLKGINGTLDKNNLIMTRQTANQEKYSPSGASNSDQLVLNYKEFKIVHEEEKARSKLASMIKQKPGNTSSSRDSSSGSQASKSKVKQGIIKNQSSSRISQSRSPPTSDATGKIKRLNSINQNSALKTSNPNDGSIVSYNYQVAPNADKLFAEHHHPYQPGNTIVSREGTLKTSIKDTVTTNRYSHPKSNLRELRTKLENTLAMNSNSQSSSKSQINNLSQVSSKKSAASSIGNTSKIEQRTSHFNFTKQLQSTGEVKQGGLTVSALAVNDCSEAFKSPLASQASKKTPSNISTSFYQSNLANPTASANSSSNNMNMSKHFNSLVFSHQRNEKQEKSQPSTQLPMTATKITSIAEAVPFKFFHNGSRNIATNAMVIDQSSITPIASNNANMQAGKIAGGVGNQHQQFLKSMLQSPRFDIVRDAQINFQPRTIKEGSSKQQSHSTSREKRIISKSSLNNCSSSTSKQTLKRNPSNIQVDRATDCSEKSIQKRLIQSPSSLISVNKVGSLTKHQLQQQQPQQQQALPSSENLMKPQYNQSYQIQHVAAHPKKSQQSTSVIPKQSFETPFQKPSFIELEEATSSIQEILPMPQLSIYQISSVNPNSFKQSAMHMNHLSSSSTSNQGTTNIPLENSIRHQSPSPSQLFDNSMRLQNFQMNTQPPFSNFPLKSPLLNLDNFQPQQQQHFYQQQQSQQLSSTESAYYKYPSYHQQQHHQSVKPLQYQQYILESPKESSNRNINKSQVEQYLQQQQDQRQVQSQQKYQHSEKSFNYQH